MKETVALDEKTPDEHARASSHSLSVVLPAYNEEQIIAYTLSAILDTLNTWNVGFEIIVVNDGSTDGTESIVAALAGANPRVRLITHPTNQGYGAALVSGFAAATKELTLFMDSDGQFDIHDLAAFFPFIDTYDAVIGYRLHRQDSWMRKLNAWGWKCLIGLVLDVHVRDIDCAFKLLHTGFLHQHPLETRGAMINAELLYRLKHGGYTWREVGVQHLPRQGGRATGAQLSVIARAFRELFIYAHKWRREENGDVPVGGESDAEFCPAMTWKSAEPVQGKQAMPLVGSAKFRDGLLFCNKDESLEYSHLFPIGNQRTGRKLKRMGKGFFHHRRDCRSRGYLSSGYPSSKSELYTIYAEGKQHDA